MLELLETGHTHTHTMILYGEVSFDGILFKEMCSINVAVYGM